MMQQFNLIFPYAIALSNSTVSARSLMSRYVSNPTASAALVTEIEPKLCHFVRPSPQHTSASTADQTVGAAHCVVRPETECVGRDLVHMRPIEYALIRLTSTQLDALHAAPFSFLYFVAEAENMYVPDSQFIRRDEGVSSA